MLKTHIKIYKKISNFVLFIFPDIYNVICFVCFYVDAIHFAYEADIFPTKILAVRFQNVKIAASYTKSKPEI